MLKRAGYLNVTAPGRARGSNVAHTSKSGRKRKCPHASLYQNVSLCLIKHHTMKMYG
jgi:hypothetical protein